MICGDTSYIEFPIDSVAFVGLLSKSGCSKTHKKTGPVRPAPISEGHPDGGVSYGQLIDINNIYISEKEHT